MRIMAVDDELLALEDFEDTEEHFLNSCIFI